MIRERRRRLGLSLHDVADRAGCTKGFLSLLERGMRGPPAPALLGRLEGALDLPEGTLAGVAALAATPEKVREQLEHHRGRAHAAQRLVELLRRGGPGGLDEAYRSGALASLVDRISPPEHAPGVRAVDELLPRGVPLINLVPAGQPTEFTDLGYPARIADQYVPAPELGDPDAFAARVTGDSMEPEYREGDIVIFSPARDIRDGMDCFARLEPDQETTFKRVYFETGSGGGELIRLQPLNARYAPRVEPRERVAGLYPAVSVTRAIG